VDSLKPSLKLGSGIPREAFTLSLFYIPLFKGTTSVDPINRGVIRKSRQNDIPDLPKQLNLTKNITKNST